MGKVIILGAGESGVGAALLAQKEGDTPFVSDFGQVNAQYRAELETNGIAFEEGGHSIESFFDAEVIIKSPGIPDTVPVVRQLREKGIPIISEIEYAYRFCSSRIIALTGSNGKTTTTSWVYHVMREAGKSVQVGGNIGKSFARLLASESIPDWYVLEVSSFQLDNIEQFKPDIALLLNISPDHLDRYGHSMEAYAQAKFRMAMNLGPEQVWIYGGQDIEVQKRMSRVSIPEMKAFGLQADEQMHAWFEGNRIWVRTEDKPLSFETHNLKLLGPHNLLNAMATVLATLSAGCEPDKIQTGLESFEPVAHRLEPVGEIDGISFVNDSKATNVDAAKYALEAMKNPVIWLAGGVDKGNDYEPIRRLVEEKVKVIVFLGAYERQKFEAFFSGKEIYTVSGMDEAVGKALEIAAFGNQVLLSPATASFDLFNNYEDRGNQFRSAVQNRMKRS